MKKLTLKRIAKKADYTIGRLEDEAGNRICDTLEPTWRNYKGGELRCRENRPCLRALTLWW